MTTNQPPERNPRIHYEDGRLHDTTRAMLEAQQIKFGLDMIEAGMAHIEFLTDVDRHPCLYDGEYVQRAIYRYENLWLPLAAKHLEERLAAPLDIEWIWHCNMLGPVLYEQDCQRLFGSTINHKLYRRSDRVHALRRSKHLWEEEYPNEPFEVDLPFGIQPKTHYDLYKSKLSYDLTAATARQCAFFYNVSLPHFLDRKYLYLCELRYKMFLYLRKYSKGAYLVPCYDNDLMWHTHQVHPLIYKADTKKLLGRFFNHDDTTNDRSPGTILYNGSVDTIHLWKEMFASEYSIAGGMFRGKISRGLYHDFCPKEAGINDAKFESTTYMAITSLALERPPAGEYGFDFYLEALSQFNKETQIIIKVDGPNLVWTQEDIPEVQLKSENVKFSFRLIVRKGKITHKTETICSKSIDLSELMQKKTSVHPFNRIVKLEYKNEVNQLYVCGVIYQKYPQSSLKVTTEDYLTCIYPEKVDDDFPVKKTEGDSCKQCNICMMAEHRLEDNKGQCMLKCRILHNAHRLMSAINIYQGRDPGVLVCCAHLIDSSNLPLPSMVSNSHSHLTLDPGLRERAFVIKDNDGDWGVITGHWRKLHENDKGTLCLKFLHCPSGMVTYPMTIQNEGSLILDIGNCRVNFADASVIFTCHPREIAQHSALAMVAGVLMVLCAPRSSTWEEGEVVSNEDNAHLSLDSSKLAAACGLYIHTPSNHYRFDRKK